MEKSIQHIHWGGDYHVWADTTHSMFKAYGIEHCILKDFILMNDPTAEDHKNEDMACFAICVALPVDV